MRSCVGALVEQQAASRRLGKHCAQSQATSPHYRPTRLSDALSIAEAVLKASAIAFMLGNLLAVGLEADLKAALTPLRDLRFVLTATLLNWLICPAFAWLISQVLPLVPPFTTGLLLIGLAPAAPFLPMVVRRAGGDLVYTVAFMLIAAICTIL